MDVDFVDNTGVDENVEVDSSLNDQSVTEQGKDAQVKEGTTESASANESSQGALSNKIQDPDKEDTKGVDEIIRMKVINEVAARTNGQVKLSWWKRPFARWFDDRADSELKTKPPPVDEILAVTLEGASLKSRIQPQVVKNH
jgi:hypothetical protein